MSSEAVYTYFVPSQYATFKTKEDAIRQAIFDNRHGRTLFGEAAPRAMGQPAPAPRAFLMQAVAEIDISQTQLEPHIPELPKV